MPKTSNNLDQIRTLKWVALGGLTVAALAQRQFRQAWADHLLSIFDLDKMGTPTVSVRDGRSFIVDGQHTLNALSRWLGDGWEDQRIQAWVYEKLTEKEEAELFLSLQERKPVEAFDNFRIALTAERPIETDIDRIVRANGQAITRRRDDGISAVGTAKRIYTRSDPNTFGMTIRLIDQPWGTPGFDALVLDGMGLFCERYNGQIDEEQAISKLTSVRGGVNGLVGKAHITREKTHQPLRQCLAAAVVDAYNIGTGSKLTNWWKS